MSWTVYRHITPSGKSYIGITSKKPEHRWNNGRGYRKDTLFGKAIEKYKWENIHHNIISTDLTEKEAKWLENYLICYYWTFVGFKDCKGYNCTLGGEGSLGHVTSEETKRKQSESRKGKPSPMKGKKTGKPAWNRGIHSSKETRRKQSKSRKGKPSPMKGKKTGKPAWNRGLQSPMKGKKTGKQSPIKGKHWKLIDGKRVYYK